MRYLLLLFCCFISTFNHALSLKKDSSPRYVVQQDDSLWSISSRYLKNPWEWKELWHANPTIKNPNRLYPGAVLILEHYHNTPYIRVLSNGTIKLSPNIRPTPINGQIPPIPLSEIKPFLNESLIMDEDRLGLAPYIVAYTAEHLLGGQGDKVYVKGLHSSKEMPQGSTIAYSIFRPGKNYLHPMTKEALGYQASLVGSAELIAGGELATILLTSINSGIKIKDKVLINNSPEFNLYFEPSTPTTQVNGFIIDMPNGMPSGNTQGAIGEVVVLSIGDTSHIKVGDVLGIYGKKRIIKDPENPLVSIKLPPERIGEAMVFRSFSKTSFALIVRSTRAVYLLDTVTNP